MERIYCDHPGHFPFSCGFSALVCDGRPLKYYTKHSFEKPYPVNFKSRIFPETPRRPALACLLASKLLQKGGFTPHPRPFEWSLPLLFSKPDVGYAGLSERQPMLVPSTFFNLQSTIEERSQKKSDSGSYGMPQAFAHNFWDWPKFLSRHIRPFSEEFLYGH